MLTGILFLRPITLFRYRITTDNMIRWVFYLGGEIHRLAIDTHHFSPDKIFIDGNYIKRDIGSRTHEEVGRFAHEGHLYVIKFIENYFSLWVDGQNIPRCELGEDIFSKKFAIRIDESVHIIKVYYLWKKGLNIYMDDNIIHQNLYPKADKDDVIYNSLLGKHNFIIKRKGIIYKELVILLDGVEIATEDNKEELKDHPYEEGKARATDKLFQLGSEDNITEITEIIGSEEFPLDNSFGSDSLNIEHELSKTVYNELKIDTIRELEGSINANLLFAIKAEISSRLSKQTGNVVGESVTRRQTIRFSVKPHQSVIYMILWKRKVRKGNYIMSADGKNFSIPYQMDYELSYEIQSKQS